MGDEQQGEEAKDGGEGGAELTSAAEGRVEGAGGSLAASTAVGSTVAAAAALRVPCRVDGTVGDLLALIADNLRIPFVPPHWQWRTPSVASASGLPEGLYIGEQLYVLKAQGLEEYCLTMARRLTAVRHVHECLREAKDVGVTLVPYEPVPAQVL